MKKHLSTTLLCLFILCASALTAEETPPETTAETTVAKDPLHDFLKLEIGQDWFFTNVGYHPTFWLNQTDEAVDSAVHTLIAAAHDLQQGTDLPELAGILDNMARMAYYGLRQVAENHTKIILGSHPTLSVLKVRTEHLLNCLHKIEAINTLFKHPDITAFISTSPEAQKRFATNLSQYATHTWSEVWQKGFDKIKGTYADQIFTSTNLYDEVQKCHEVVYKSRRMQDLAGALQNWLKTHTTPTEPTAPVTPVLLGACSENAATAKTLRTLLAHAPMSVKPIVEASLVQLAVQIDPPEAWLQTRTTALQALHKLAEDAMAPAQGEPTLYGTQEGFPSASLFLNNAATQFTDIAENMKLALKIVALSTQQLQAFEQRGYYGFPKLQPEDLEVLAFTLDHVSNHFYACVTQLAERHQAFSYLDFKNMSPEAFHTAFTQHILAPLAFELGRIRQLYAFFNDADAAFYRQLFADKDPLDTTWGAIIDTKGVNFKGKIAGNIVQYLQERSPLERFQAQVDFMRDAGETLLQANPNNAALAKDLEWLKKWPEVRQKIFE